MWILMEEISSVNDNGEIGATFGTTPIKCSESFEMMRICMMAYIVELGTQGYSAEPITDSISCRLRSEMYVRDLYICKTESV